MHLNPVTRTCAAVVLLCLVSPSASTQDVTPGTEGALDGRPYRVLVSTDIGGSDPDDFQSLVHLLLYADVLDLEGLVSSPPGPGRLAHIHEVIDQYALDAPRLRAAATSYPSADALRAISKQGETEVAPYAGVRRPTDGSTWIVACARRPDPRPLHVLVWGGLEDLAQALHDAPDILPKLRVHWVGGPNKKWGPDAYHYLATHHPSLWMIESNSTYRGWFVGGRQDGDWGNGSFVRAHVAGRGALGRYFTTHLGGVIKMGDSPTVGWLLRGTPDSPGRPGWGGRFVRAWERLDVVHDRLTTRDDHMEQFGILELRLPLGPTPPDAPEGHMIVENQQLRGHVQDGSLRFRFCPRDAKTFSYTLRSNVPALDGRSGAITAFATPASAASRPSSRFPNWWTDDPSPDAAEGIHQGARSVSMWRESFLRDFALRFARASGNGRSDPVRSSR